ncbi:MAG: leucine-rich repeat domain-containing protein [Parachlamydiaceae bacterium]|nr:leucine-rich repeat domain-containing protein [Parachlamydiaceae bacterium]
MITGCTQFNRPVIDTRPFPTGKYSRFGQCAERFFRISQECFEVKRSNQNQMGSITVEKVYLPKLSPQQIALRVALCVLSLGLIPLVMLIGKCLYRFHNTFTVSTPKSPQELTEPLARLAYSFLDISSLASLMRVSTKCRALASHDVVWRGLVNFYDIIMPETTEYNLKELFAIQIRGKVRNQAQLLDHLRYDHVSRKVPKLLNVDSLDPSLKTLKKLKEQTKTVVAARNDKITEVSVWFNAKGNASSGPYSLRFSHPELPTEIYDFPLKFLSLDFNSSSANHFELNNTHFRKLTKLSHLILTSGKLTKFPELIFQIPTLAALNLEKNKLSSLPEGLSQLPLRVLNLSDNELTSLPTDFSKLKLTELNLMMNRLTDVTQLCSITQLRSLALSANHSRNAGYLTLPLQIGELTNLENLTISFLKLTSLPSSLDRLIRLRFIDISQNALTHIPEVLGRLPALSMLTCLGNPFCKAPDYRQELLRVCRQPALQPNLLTVMTGV